MDHRSFVSTGQLPPADLVGSLVEEAHRRFRSNNDGANSQVYPALARVSPDLFGLCVVETNGNLYAAGDDTVQFSIMSVSKPFVFALVHAALGADEVRAKIGVNATGLPFSSRSAVEASVDGRTNPMVNPGAIATTSLVPGSSAEGRWRFIRDGLSRFAGRELALDDDIFLSASRTNHANRELAELPGDSAGWRAGPRKQSSCTRGSAR